jgi:hypothetical protein
VERGKCASPTKWHLPIVSVCRETPRMVTYTFESGNSGTGYLPLDFNAARI